MKKTLLRTVTAILLCIILLSAFASCTVEKAYPGAPSGFRPCNDGSEGVILYVPAAWSVDYSTGIPTAYFSFTDSTMINMVKVTKEALGTRSIAEYFSEYESIFKTTIKDFELIPLAEDVPYIEIPNEAYGFSMYVYTYSFKISTTAQTYKFAQAFFKTATDSDLYIVTYGTTYDKFDLHIEDFTEVLKNVKPVTEPVSMGGDAPTKPTYTNDSAPNGYSALTAEYVDYILYVPSSWTPLLNTGMTAAARTDDRTVVASVTAFNPQNNDRVFDDKDYDSFFESTEKTLTDAFGTVTFANPEQKYEKVDFEKQTGQKNATARKYVYSLVSDGTDYTYEQYIIIKDGYFYILTMSCKSALYFENKSAFDGIAEAFKFKG